MNTEYINKLKSKKIAILGFGIEGKALGNFFFNNRISNVTIYDTKEVENIYNYEVRQVSKFNPSELEGFDIIFLSPGISPYENHLLTLNLSSLTNLWFDLYPNTKVIGVTGTKGKSTTASMIYHVLKSINKKVALAGNIGIPLLAIQEPENLDFVILELSSYQLFNFKHRIDSACFLNLYEEHLTWHDGFNNYKNDKLNLCRNVKKFIVANYQFKNLFKNFKPTPNYFNFENNQNKLAIELSKDCTKTLLGLYGIQEKEIERSFQTFEGLNHRLNLIKKFNNNIQVIDDSLSTIPESTIKACLAYKQKDIFIILGGKDRGINYEKIAKLPKNVKKAFCFDNAGEKMFATLSKRASFFDTFKEAITECASQAKPNSIILFSPAAPSNSPFRDYKERSEYLLKILDSL